LTSLYQIQKRYRLTTLIMVTAVIVLVSFWAFEFRSALVDVDERQEQYITEQHEQIVEMKAQELEALFHDIYQNARTISLLPMVRELSGSNRLSEDEDVVADGRLSLDAHRTIQQIYTNLENNVSVSEVYYVLDRFDPNREVPLFMYDHHIAGINDIAASNESTIDNLSDIPEELEDEEYQYFPVVLAWFRQHAPSFLWSHSLDDIPARISPLLRTCDNSQYDSIQHGDVTNSHGLIFSLPVYRSGTLDFKGIITVILRANVLEATLLGVPYLPITDDEIAQQRQQGWDMPEVSTFQLIQDEQNILIQDRRGSTEGYLDSEGHWIEREYIFSGGITWKLRHYLTPTIIGRMVTSYDSQRNNIIESRLSVMFIIIIFLHWAFYLLIKSRNELMHLAYFDDLTGLPNRVQMIDNIQKWIHNNNPQHQHFSLLIINIANFSMVNQLYGHLAGDRLLTRLSQRLAETLYRHCERPALFSKQSAANTMIARLSGDEFAIISRKFVLADDIKSLIHHLHDAISSPISIEQQLNIKSDIRIGAAVYPADADNASKLMAAADYALQECRRHGTEVFYLFDNELRTQRARYNILSEESKHALAQQQFEIMYQPKQSLSGGHIVSLEALLRWRHPESGYISPVEFIPILEENKGIIEVGYWILRQACHDIATLDSMGFKDVAISVNVSVRQLCSEGFADGVSRILRETDTAPSRIILEITESLMMENAESNLIVLRQLEALGLHIAIDDFGTGYSSLTYLQNLPLTYLKLDKSFIDSMTDERTTHIVKMVIDLARGLKLTTIAEGIETLEQREMLKTLGCDIIQGYLLSRPKPLTELIDWMQSEPTSVDTRFG